MPEIPGVGRFLLGVLALILEVSAGCGRASEPGVSPERMALLHAGLRLGGFEGRIAGLEIRGTAIADLSRLRDAAQSIQRSSPANPCDQARDAALLRASSGNWRQAVDRMNDLEASWRSEPWCRAEKAAFLVELGKRERDPRLLLEALESSTGVAGAAAPIAAFNRALALETLGLREPAMEAWRQAALEGDDGAWKLEARRRAEALSISDPATLWLLSLIASNDDSLDSPPDHLNEAAALAPQLARQVGIEVLLARGGRLSEGSRTTEASRCVSIAEAMGRAIRAAGGDPVLERLSAEARAALASGRPQTTLWRGLTLYAEARHEQRKENYTSASRLFREAAAELEEADSTLETWARHGAAVADFFLGMRADASRTFLLLSAAAGADQPSLGAQLDWSTGVAADFGGDLASALRHFDRAISAFDTLGELENAAAVRCLRAYILIDLGRESEAGEDLLGALRNLARVSSDATAELIIDSWIHLLCERRFPRTVDLFHRELLRIASTSKRATAISHAHLLRGEDPERSTTERLSDLSAAAKAADRIGDSGERARKMILIDSTRAALLANIDPAQSVIAGRRALAGIDRWHLEPFRIETLRNLGRSLALAGHADAAESTLLSAVQELQGRQEREESWARRAQLLSDAQAVYSQLAEVRLRYRSDEQGAFRAIDAGRTNFAAAPRADNPMASFSRVGPSANQVAEQLREGTYLIEMAIFSDRFSWWVVGGGKSLIVSVPIDRAELVSRADALSLLYARNDVAAPEAALAFSRLVLGPISHLFVGAKLLVVVPDPALAGIPWPVLPEPRDSLPVVASRAVLISPSAATYLRLRDNGERSGAPTSVRVLGAPAVDTTLFPQLPVLPRAQVEAESVATLYPRGEVLTGSRATASVALAAPLPAVLHFAAHGLAHPSDSDTASLVLAVDAEHVTGLLTASEIASQHLAEVQVVVLAACSGASGRTMPYGGTVGLAQAFLASGVPSVVASLWPIDDDASLQIAIALHRRIAQGETPSAALRALQLEWSKNAATRPSNAWKGLMVLGGR